MNCNTKHEVEILLIRLLVWVYVSYDHLLRLTSDISNRVCEQFTVDGIVCPPKLCSKLLTIAAVDNIDYYPSFATVKNSFRGTGISLIQHLSHEFKGYSCDLLVINKTPVLLQYIVILILFYCYSASKIHEFVASFYQV